MENHTGPFKHRKLIMLLTTVVILIVVVLLSERIAKLIPDSKTGVLGFVRKVLKFVSLYTPNVK